MHAKDFVLHESSSEVQSELEYRGELDIIRQGNLFEVGMLLLRIPKVTANHVKQTVGQDNTAVLSLLLNHPTTDPNESLIYMIEYAATSFVTLILNSPGIKYSVKGKDPIMKAACRSGKIELVTKVMKDKRFSPGEYAYLYIIYVIELSTVDTTIDILELLFSDVRFRVPQDKKCELFCSAVANINALMFLVEVLGKDGITSGCITKAIKEHHNSGVASFEVLLKAAPQFQACAIDISFGEGRLEVFKKLVNLISDDWVLHTYKICCTRSDINRVNHMIDSGRVQKNTTSLCFCLYDVNQSTKVLHSIIDTYSIPLCNTKGGVWVDIGFRRTDTDCLISYLLSNRFDKIACEILEIYGVAPICKHACDFSMMALDNQCLKAANYLLKIDPYITTALQKKVFATRNEACMITMMRNLNRVDHDLINKYLLDRDHYIVAMIARYSTIDLAWQNYLFLRIAAKDKTSKTYDVLHGVLPCGSTIEASR